MISLLTGPCKFIMSFVERIWGKGGLYHVPGSILPLPQLLAIFSSKAAFPFREMNWS